MKRQRVLALTPRIPFPPVGGEKLKNYHSLKALARIYDVDWYSLHDGTVMSPEDQVRFDEFKQQFRSVRLFRQPKWKSMFQTLWGLLAGSPLQVAYFDHPEMQRAVDEILPQEDGAVAFLIRTAPYLEGRSVKKILDMTDSISSHYFQALQKGKSFLWRRIYSIEAPRLRHYEEKIVREFDASLFVNRQECESYSSVGNCLWLPLGVRGDLFDRPSRVKTAHPSVSFLGKMNYQPNIEAVTWFCEKILPCLPGDFQFFIVGAEPAPEVWSLAEKDVRVKVTGFVEDPFSILQESWAVIAPLRIGGGVQNKVLEAMALACPVLMTSIVNIPIGCPQDACLVMDSEEEWVNTLSGLRGPESLQQMGHRARQWMRNWGDWEAYEIKYARATQKIFGP